MADEGDLEENIAEEVADAAWDTAAVGEDGEGGKQAGEAGEDEDLDAEGEAGEGEGDAGVVDEEDQVEETDGGEGEEQPVGEEEDGSAQPRDAGDGDEAGEAADEVGEQGDETGEVEERGDEERGDDPDEAASDPPGGTPSDEPPRTGSWKSLGNDSPLSVEALGRAESAAGAPLQIETFEGRHDGGRSVSFLAVETGEALSSPDEDEDQGALRGGSGQLRERDETGALNSGRSSARSASPAKTPSGRRSAKWQEPPIGASLPRMFPATGPMQTLLLRQELIRRRGERLRQAKKDEAEAKKLDYKAQLVADKVRERAADRTMKAMNEALVEAARAEAAFVQGQHQSDTAKSPTSKGKQPPASQLSRHHAHGSASHRSVLERNRPTNLEGAQAAKSVLPVKQHSRSLAFACSFPVRGGFM